MRGVQIFVVVSITCGTLNSYADAQSPDEPKRLAEVVVDSTPLGQILFESAQPASVLSGNRLLEESHSTLGETLADEPGMSSTSFGAGASRPVIRGLGGDRIRVLQDGLGSQDVSNTSPDHAVTIDPALVDKIEVVRGPAALLYGTSAVGGVVNAFDNRIPEELPRGPVSGTTEIRGGTVDDEKAILGKIEVPVGSFAFHADGVLRDTHDYAIPGFARTPALRDSGEELDFPEPKGTLPFSDTEVQSGAVGGSYLFDNGFLGVAGSAYNTKYGVPNGENDVSIDLDQRRIDARGEIENPIPVLEKARLNFGYVDYNHTEFEGAEPGTTFSNEGIDSRLELTHAPIGPVKGLIGFQLLTSDFSAVGEEAFQPPTDSQILSVFLFEELPVTDDVKVQAGVRYDSSDLDSSSFPGDDEARVSPVENVSRTFSTVSGSTGLVWTPTPEYSYALSLSYTERAPAAQELFADGPHVATAAFEVGDPDLDPERSFGVDLTVRKRSGRVTGSLGAFTNQFYDFINLDPSGEERDDLQVFDFVAEEAQFFGVDGQMKYHLLGAIDEGNEPAEDLALFFQPNWVWAADRDTGEPIPRIPAFRLGTGVEYRRAELSTRLEYTRVFEQGRNAEFETETDGYNLVNAALVYVLNDLFPLPVDVSVFARGENLLNEKARNSTSFIKDVAPLPGANLVAGLRFSY